MSQSQTENVTNNCHNDKIPSADKMFNNDKGYSREFSTGSQNFIQPVIVRKQEVARRHIPCQHEFVPYKNIVEYLKQLVDEFPDRIQLLIIGESKQGQNLYVAVISKQLPYPSLSAIIEAGSNGSELYSVSSALVLIDYLVKTPNSILLMDYYIIPCLNPDAYDFTITNQQGKKKKKNHKTFPHKMDLTLEFPSAMKIQDPNALGKPYDPEIVALYRVIETYNTCARIFISLRENGKSILYPWGYCSTAVIDGEHLKKIASSGQKAMQEDVVIGAMGERGYIRQGSVVDYVKFYHPVIKFVYSLHLNCDEIRCKSKILEKAEPVCNGVRAMSRSVFKFYVGTASGLVDSTTVKIPNVSDP